MGKKKKQKKERKHKERVVEFMEECDSLANLFDRLDEEGRNLFSEKKLRKMPTPALKGIYHQLHDNGLLPDISEELMVAELVRRTK